ncbi:uncharacterized protein IUM83_19089 [Phytophthora cinnamomi]|uniref:uncharacterized protein n=1 Tax=Phytophthora cinnamomi TaxID=4785 RepID=UPI00355A5ED5|nr:hypothetical protein IUM83_19089 [Phytophthora cinnamomi]
MKTSACFLVAMALLAAAALGVHADQDAATPQPEVEEKGTWAPMIRALWAADDDSTTSTSTSTSQPVADEKASWAPLRALKTMDGDQISTSQPVTNEKASWAPIRALRAMDDAKQQPHHDHHPDGKPAPKYGDKHH